MNRAKFDDVIIRWMRRVSLSGGEWRGVSCRKEARLFEWERRVWGVVDAVDMLQHQEFGFP